MNKNPCLFSVHGPDVVHLLKSGPVGGGEPLDTGNLSGEGEVGPALDGDPPLLREAVPLHLNLY